MATPENTALEHTALTAALEWYLDAGVDEALADEPQQKTAQPVIKQAMPDAPGAAAAPGAPLAFTRAPATGPIEGTPGLREEAIRLARAANTLDELREAIAGFDGLAIKKTATNLVFCDGNPQAPVMLVGEAPGGDEDRLGKPFVGVSGQLLDKMLQWIQLDRGETDPTKSLYISNILNWRPPGNRTPTPQEVEIGLPFIEKHIALVKPKILIFAGGVSTKALLGTTQGISRLRGQFHAYAPLTKELFEQQPAPIPALATYHPAYLLRTPAQKGLVWQDLLRLKEKLKDL